jgi:hypothetical protein
MANITNPAGKRTSNSWKTVPTNKGSRASRLFGHIENALVFHTHNALYSAATGIVGGVAATANAIGNAPDALINATIAGVKWLAHDPSAPALNPYKSTGSHPSTGGKVTGTGTHPSTGGNNKVSSPGAGQVGATIQQSPDSTYSWNLPPHKWSLPIDPGSISNSVHSPSSDIHSKRRGMIFTGIKYPGTTSTVDPKTGKKIRDADTHYDRNYGFQFLWNPETFSQNTSVNWGITPNQNDVLATLTGLVTANSTIDFTLRIDRTNDFAAGKEYFKFGAIKDAALDARNLTANDFAKYYTEGQAPNSQADFSTNIGTKITDLMRRGTEADLEFLYRTINGDGYQLLGENTSNLSFLKPTIIRLDLGPQKLIGMIQSVNVTHLAFTRELIPIRTDVALSIDLRTATSFLPSSSMAATTAGAAQ